MTWRSAIFFSALVGPLVFSLGATNVSGSVSIQGRRARKQSAPDLSGVVLWLDPETGGWPDPRPGPKLEMVQRDKTFTPHILPVPVASSVSFPNFDPIFHNAFSNYNGQVFDVGLYPPGTSRSVRFNRPGIVRVFCNIHANMSAVLVVLGSPYYAVSDQEGAFILKNVPPGTYRLQVYHERATEQSLSALGRTIAIQGASQSLGTILVPENAYVAIPHLNKYGKPYGNAQDPGSYPGARH